jgi:hypothetical protein
MTANVPTITLLDFNALTITTNCAPIIQLIEANPESQSLPMCAVCCIPIYKAPLSVLERVRDVLTQAAEGPAHPSDEAIQHVLHTDDFVRFAQSLLGS